MRVALERTREDNQVPEDNNWEQQAEDVLKLNMPTRSSITSRHPEESRFEKIRDEENRRYVNDDEIDRGATSRESFVNVDGLEE